MIFSTGALSITDILFELLAKILIVLIFFIIIFILIFLLDIVTSYLASRKILFAIKYLNIVQYFLFGLFVLVLSVSFGPYVIEHFTRYTISNSYTMTPSEATSYTLQALVTTLIGSYIINLKDKK
jgi:hypothetical protein